MEDKPKQSYGQSQGQARGRIPVVKRTKYQMNIITQILVYYCRVLGKQGLSYFLALKGQNVSKVL